MSQAELWKPYRTYGSKAELKEFIGALAAARVWLKEANRTEAECAVRLRGLEALRAGMLARYKLHEPHADAMADLNIISLCSNRPCPSISASTSPSTALQLVAEYSRWVQMCEDTVRWLTEGKKNDSVAETITGESIDARHRELKDLEAFLFDEEH
jgi:hypothetical protein